MDSTKNLEKSRITNRNVIMPKLKNNSNSLRQNIYSEDNDISENNNVQINVTNKNISNSSMGQESSTSKGSSYIPKPKFLEFLETHIKKQLKENNIVEMKPVKLRLQIYSEAFEWLLQALKSYRPLLAAIKREYEMNIDHLRSELRKIEPMKEIIWTLSQEYDSRIIKMRNKEANDILEMKAEKKKITKEIWDLKAEKETLRVEMVRLQEDLINESTFYRTEADSRKLLITDMNDLRCKLKDMERLAKNLEDDENKEDPVKLRWAYEQAKKSIINANKRILDLETNYSEVIPKSQFDECYNELMEVKEQLNSANNETVELQNEIQILHNKCDALNIQIDYFNAQINNIEENSK